MVGYMTASEAATKWNISHRRVITLCNENRIEGVGLLGKMWIIPVDAEKPMDARKKKDTNETGKKKYIVTIEETVSNSFEVYAKDDKEAIDITTRKYKKCEFVLEPGNLTFKQMELYNTEDDYYTEWIEF